MREASAKRPPRDGGRTPQRSALFLDLQPGPSRLCYVHRARQIDGEISLYIDIKIDLNIDINVDINLNIDINVDISLNIDIHVDKDIDANL